MNSESEKILEGAGVIILAREEILSEGANLRSMAERLANGDLSSLPEEMKTALREVLDQNVKSMEMRLAIVELLAQLLEIVGNHQAQIDELTWRIDELNRGDDWRNA